MSSVSPPEPRAIRRPRRRRLNQIRDAQEAVRVQAASLFLEGVTHSEIARRLGVSRRVVIAWHKRFDVEGVEGLRSKPAGRPRWLTQEQYVQIREALLEGPAAFGYSTQLWTLERIADLIERLTGVRYSVGHVWRLLRKRLDFTCQKPTCKATERDEPAIELWKTKTWPAIKRGHRNRTLP
jgi:transposase